LLGDKLSQDPLDRFAPNDRYLFVDDRSGLLFWYLKGGCHGNQLKSKNWRFLRTNLLCRLPFGNGLKYRNSDFKRLGRMNFSTLYTILMTFVPETPEFTLLTIAPFVAIWQKSAYHAKYLRMFWTYLNLLYRIGRRISGDDFPNIRLVVAQGTLLLQPVIYGRCSQTSRGMTFTLCFGIRQRIGRS